MFKKVAISLVLTVLVLPATAHDFQKGFTTSKGGDYATAPRDWSSLAAKGDAKAQHSLGLKYSRGQGVPQDYVEAVKWFRKAAEQGHAGAQYTVGVRYSLGHGIEKNIVQAYMWWSLAALEGHQIADGFRDSAARHMTPTQISDAMRLARKWWLRHEIRHRRR